ncbi:MAG: hypothetical protein GY943_28880, partial [Chloroflexi bacterium]|nr:hypothetical protein [Chloroflexota bacterium]
MLKRIIPVILVIFAIVLSGCNDDPAPEVVDVTAVVDEESEPNPTPTSAPGLDEGEDEIPASAMPSEILISELLLGIPGNNRQEFIELYNTEADAHSLDGWSLWYQLKDDQEEELVIAWESGDVIPPFGHYLLVHEEQDLGILPDAVFTVNLSERKGGLVLRNQWGDAVDKLGWGDASPDGYYSGEPVTAVSDGPSWERLPGGEQGNQTNSFNNVADFTLNPAANPQNSGSLMTPFPGDSLAIRVEAPDNVAPTETFDYQIIVENLATVVAEDVLVSVPIADGFVVVTMPEGAET